MTRNSGAPRVVLGRVRLRLVMVAEIEAMFTIAPRPCKRMARASAWQE